ncbi:MAG: TIGR00296 family protein [Nitrososphaerota archaeon]|nr:TIGR00296 family protein [Nitrososphaerota archaeon]MDG7025683.1 TIGR00296 family protein [Nitrososphaerota archaeon]
MAEGRAAVALARETLEAQVRGSRPPPPPPDSGVFSEKRGVFVTLSTERGGTRALRGCIGYPEAIKPLGRAIREVTAFASEDPRFPAPVSAEELGRIVVEVSVLTAPRDVSAPSRRDLPSKIRLGADGLIVSNQYASGLLLPQVATEQGWDQETFISEACAKAGLSMDAWLREGTRVQVFQAEIFAETSPGGRVERVEQAIRG